MFSKRARQWLPALFVLLACVPPALGADLTQSLDGPWRFALDRLDTGIAERWCDRQLPETIRLPGSLPGQGDEE